MVIIGVVIDVLIVTGEFQASFSFLRLGRTTRLLRIAMVVERLKKRHTAINSKLTITLSRGYMPPTCNWTHVSPTSLRHRALGAAAALNPWLHLTSWEREHMQAAISSLANACDAETQAYVEHVFTTAQDSKVQLTWLMHRIMSSDPASVVKSGLKSTFEARSSAMQTMAGLIRGKMPRKARAPKFVCFISHLMREAASDARFLHDTLQMMVNTDAFLSEHHLTDLTRLYYVVRLHSRL